MKKIIRVKKNLMMIKIKIDQENKNEKKLKTDEKNKNEEQNEKTEKIRIRRMVLKKQSHYQRQI